MKKILIGVVLGIIIGVPTSFSISKLFSDVSQNVWYSKAIESIADKKIATGYADGTFRPENYVNRAEVALMLENTIKYLENKFDQSAIESVRFDGKIPLLVQNNDPFSLDKENGPAISISNDVINYKVSYTGGCEDHNFDLYAENEFLESDPVQSSVFLIHENNGDICESQITETLQFDLKPLKESYQGGYQTSKGEIQLGVWAGESILWEF